jgi:CheY-like chemotaxis protein/phosphoribosyl 1,2-cyclic phosphodiesterase
MDLAEPSRGRVLVAEDMEENALVIRALLEEAGYRVETARDGEECLQRTNTFGPDLIILDLLLPRIQGLQVLQMLKSDPATRDIGVIICSAKDYRTEVKQAMELGAVDFLSKPIQQEELLSRVHQFFELRETPVVGVPRHAPVGKPADFYRPRIESGNGLYRLWGTRGSIPVSGPGFVRHGGNTTCMEVTVGDDRIIFDAGTGIRDLGLSLMSGKPRRLHLFITHTHWDHIQGFPFFTPAYVPGYDITIYASPHVDKDLKSIFEGQLDRAYFPVQLEDMQARMRFVNLADQPVTIGDVQVAWESVFHPSPTVGYKIRTMGRTIAFLPDNEFMKGYLDPPETIAKGVKGFSIHARLLEFLAGVDVLIHEAQYLNEEYVTKIGWGHTSLSNACALVKLTRPGRWIVTHHDPLHEDAFLQEKLNLTRYVLRRLGSPTPVDHAYDGMVEYL